MYRVKTPGVGGIAHAINQTNMLHSPVYRIIVRLLLFKSLYEFFRGVAYLFAYTVSCLDVPLFHHPLYVIFGRTQGKNHLTT